jgi:hypothetical protein
MVTQHEARCLRRFAQQATGWERPASITGIGQGTYDSLVRKGYLEQKWEGPDRFLQLTHKGKRAVYEGLF